VIQGGSCDWVLDLKNSQTRTIAVSLAYAEPGSPLPAGWPTDGSPVKVAARIISKCERNPSNNHVSYGTMSYTGQQIECPLNVSFYFNGIWYGLRMDPSLFAQTTWVQAICTSLSSNWCNAWAVTPIPNQAINMTTGQSMAVAELILPSFVGSETGTPLGLFYVAFSATIQQ
jgi:hypothetical protein